MICQVRRSASGLHRVALGFLALLLSACGPNADDAERDFRAHPGAFERVRRIAVEAGAASGQYSIKVMDPVPEHGSDRWKEISTLLKGTGVESVRALRDSVSGWHVSFLVDAVGIAPSGGRLTVEHAATLPRPYSEFHEIRNLGGGWYVSDYAW